MNYLRKKLQAIMASADFKGYLREVTGYPLTLTDCMGSDLVSLSVTGNAVQDGTPSPDAPVEVQGVGERTGNLFDSSTLVPGRSISGGGAGLPWNYNTSSLKMSTEKIYIKPNTKYTLITYNNDVYWRDRIIEANADDICTVNHFQYTYDNSYDPGKNIRIYPFTTNADTDYMIVRFQRVDCTDITNADTYDLRCMLLEGSHTAETIPQYEPYGYKVPVEVGGINLLDYTKATDRFGNPLTIIDDGVIWDKMINYYFYIPCDLKSGMTVRLSCKSDYPENSDIINSFNVHYVDGSADYQTIEYPITLKNDVDRIQIRKRNASTESETPIKVTDIMLVKGSYTAETMPPYEPYHEPQEFNVYMDKPLYGLRLATDSTGYYTYQDDDGNKYLCDTIAIDFGKRTAKRTDNLKYRSLGDVARWSEYTGILYDDVYHMFTLNGVNPGQKIKTYYTDTDGTNKDWGVDSIVSNVMPTDSTYPVNTTPTVCTGATPGNFADCIRYWFLKTDVDAYTGDTVGDRVAAYWEDFCADRDVMALYIINPATTDISALQDWDAMPSTWRGTVVISAATSVPPSSMTAKYYATKKED